MRRNTMLAIGLCGTLGLLVASELFAATYYVSPSGSDANSGTFANSALRTIKRAASLAQSGDSVQVAAGEYSDTFDVVGRQGSSQLQFIASEPGSVTISGQVNVVDSNGIVFHGFKFAGNMDRFLTWEGSYDGTISDCQFLRGRNALLIKSGSLTLDDCALSDFASDGIEVDGAAKLIGRNLWISGCQGSAIKVLKNAHVELREDSNIVDNVGDGIRVAVTDDSIPVTRGGCDCTGTSPHSMKQEAYNLLADVNPQTGTYRQAIQDARSAINSSLNASLWQDGWTATAAGGPTIYDRSATAIELLHAVYTDDIDFFISGDDVVVNQPFKLSLKVLGAEISNGSLYDVPVTTSVKAGSENYEPWGPFSSPTLGNVNDESNPRNFADTKTHPPGTRVSISGRSWLKTNNSHSGTDDNHWDPYLTVSSSSQSANLIVLRDGDAVPNLSGYGGQASAASFLESYIEDGRIKLAKNQAIFLFELGTTNLTNSAADFQDLVVLLTMQPVNSKVTAEEADLILRAITLLLEADKNLASCAISQARCAGGNAAALAEAESFFNDGLREAAAEHFKQASVDYKFAWEATQRALDGASGSGTARSTSPQRPPGWTGIDMPSVIVNSSVLTGNNSGVAMFTAGSFEARQSDFSQNRQWGTRLRGEVTLDNCDINTNGIAGVWLEDGRSATLIVNNLSLQDNVKQGLFLKNCDLRFDAADLRDWSISGSEVVIAGEGSDLVLSGVTISNGSQAAVSIVDGSIRATTSSFSDSGHGVSATNSRCTFTDCELTGNTIGLKLTDMSSSDLSLVGTTVRGNASYGVYCIDSTLTFDAALLRDATITGSETLFAGSGSTLTFERLTIAGGSKYGLANFDGDLTVNSCTLSGNNIGLYSDNVCSATGSTFTQNTTTGASVVGSATFTDCVFEKNPNGLQITNDTAGSVKLVTSQIKDNTLYGVWCDDCTLTFDAAMQAGWTVQNNGSNFGATGSTLTFNGFTISNGTTYGIVTEDGTLHLNNSMLTNNGTGAFIDADSQLIATDTRFIGNSLYGAAIKGQASLQRCSFDHNTHGLQLDGTTEGKVTCTATTVSNSTESGLHLESCTLTLTGSGIDGLTLTDNQQGIKSTNSTLVFNGFSSTSNVHGAWLSSSDVTITNSTFTGSTHGLWAKNNNKLDVISSTFSGNSAYGVYLEGTGSLHDCTITGNGGGLYMNATNLTDATLTGTDIFGNTQYGIFVNNASLDLSAQPAEDWAIDGNGINVAGYAAAISLTGVTMTSATNYGVHAEYGSLNLHQSKITSNSDGVCGLNITGFTVDQSHISGSSTGKGVYNLNGGLTMRNSVVSGAPYGVYSKSPLPATLYNVTIADASEYGVYLDEGDLTVMNTIISGTNGVAGLYREPSATLTHSYNLIYGFAAPLENATMDATELLDPPRFEDAAHGDFRLAKGSPAINAGADLEASGVTVDMLGNARPSRKVFEIGAYEYIQDGGSLRVLDWREKR